MKESVLGSGLLQREGAFAKGHTSSRVSPDRGAARGTNAPASLPGVSCHGPANQSQRPWWPSDVICRSAGSIRAEDGSGVGLGAVEGCRPVRGAFIHSTNILLTRDTKTNESRFLVFWLQVVRKRTEACK